MSEIRKKRKAYIARNNAANEDYAIIVFGENATEAKNIAYGDDIMDNYTDIRVQRAHAFDRFVRDDWDVLNIGDSAEIDRVFWEEGWYQWTGNPRCDNCGRWEYDTLPESFIGEDQLCPECRRKTSLR